MAAGAATDLMDQAWWSPGLTHPDGRSAFSLWFTGGIFVNQDGRRFVVTGASGKLGAVWTEALIEAHRNILALVRHVHLPVQSGSDRMLKAMRRSYRSERYLAILDRVRAAMPEAAITTDIIVGFPGETEEDFDELMTFVRNVEFDRVGVFTYSDEEGTPAFDAAAAGVGIEKKMIST